MNMSHPRGYFPYGSRENPVYLHSQRDAHKVMLGNAYCMRCVGYNPMSLQHPDGALIPASVRFCVGVVFSRSHLQDVVLYSACHAPDESGVVLRYSAAVLLNVVPRRPIPGSRVIPPCVSCGGDGDGSLVGYPRELYDPRVRSAPDSYCSACAKLAVSEYAPWTAWDFSCDDIPKYVVRDTLAVPWAQGRD